MDHATLIEQAAHSIIANSGIKPPAPEIVTALLQSEKTAKQNKVNYQFNQFLGKWRLCFITGTKKTRQRAGIMMGAGRYLPPFVKINLSYSQESLTPDTPNDEGGKMENSVQVGLMKMKVYGPAKFLPKKNILAFDFTRMTIEVLGVKVYQGFIRGGEKSERNFYQNRVANQAFFAYFFVNNSAIAARGRGGGLALWGRDS
jgi:hypothetical protein